MVWDSSGCSGSYSSFRYTGDGDLREAVGDVTAERERSSWRSWLSWSSVTGRGAGMAGSGVGSGRKSCWCSGAEMVWMARDGMCSWEARVVFIDDDS